ncbi:MAG: RrF2 family transcriptional regulator [Candidatus Zixiibacteriota bacterium]
MRLSRKSDYALRAVRHLSNLEKGRLGSINSIAEAESVPREFLAKILKDLTRSNVLVSYQGVTGGYRIARPAREISFLDVIEAIDGPIHLNLCTEESGLGGVCRCDRGQDCSMRSFWQVQEKAFKKNLGKEHFAKYRNSRKR